MKKANSSGTNCTTRRYAEVPSPRLLEPPAKTSRDPEKQLSCSVPKILFKGFHRMKYVNNSTKEALSKSPKHGDYTKEQSRSRTDHTYADASTQGHQHSVRPAASDIPQYTGGTLRRT